MSWRQCEDDVKFENVLVVAETEAALLLRRDGDDVGDEAWFPKSRIDWVEPEGGEGRGLRGQTITVYIEGWLVDEKGWGG